MSSPSEGAVAPSPVSSWSQEFGALFRLGWPLVFAQLAQNALFTTDVIMMGWLGPQYLAAGALATAFINPLFLLGVGIVGAVAPLVAQARGARDIKAVRRIVRQGFWIAILLATALIPIVWQVKPIFAALGQDPELTELASQYVYAIAWMFYPALAVIVLRSFIAAFGHTRIILFVTLGSVVVNAVLAYVLMFGHLGLPRLELMGTAIATGLTNVLMFVALALYVLTNRKFRRYHVFVRFWKPDWSRFRQILQIGWPIGITIMAEVGLFSVAAVMMGWLGTDEVAAHAVALQLSANAFMVPLGLGIAATVRVGMAYGARNSEAVRKAGWTSVIVGTGFMALTCVLFLTMPHQLVGIFLDIHDPANGHALTLAATYLGVAALFQLADGAQVVAAHSLRGLSDTKIPMLTAFIGYWLIGLPVAYFLGFVLEMRGVGIWLGLAVGLVVVAVVLCSRFAMRSRLGLLPWEKAALA